MDDKDFLSFFWNLKDNQEQNIILENSEKIVNSVIAKQKFEKNSSNLINHGELLSKYKEYVKIVDSPCEDLLYLFKRLVFN